MSSSGESPFRRDEPVGRSGWWIWLSAGGLAVLGATSIALQVAAADSGGGIMQLFIVICLEAGLLWLLVRAAGTTSGCRQSRSFDSMARALRAQLRFWIAWTVFTVLSLLALLIAWWMIRERSGNVRAMIEKSHQRQNQAASVEP